MKLQLTSEDVKGDEMDLGVSVLASLRGGHLHNLAGPVLRDNGDDCDDGDNDILRSAESIGGFHKSMSLISFSKIARKKGFAIF